MTDQITADYTAEIAERTVVVTWPDNDRGGATPPSDGWADRVMDQEPTLYEVDEGSISGCSALRWRNDARSDAELIAHSLMLVTGRKGPAAAAPLPADQERTRLLQALDASYCQALGHTPEGLLAAYEASRTQTVDRAALSAKLWEIAERHIIAEWICCEPLEPGHDLCAKGYEALGMVKSLLVDADPGEAWNPSAPLLDALTAVLPATTNHDTTPGFAGRADNGQSARADFLNTAATWLFTTGRGSRQVADRILGKHRTEVLRGAAARIDRTDLPQDDVDCFDNGARWATKLLRRMADETAVTETCDHDSQVIDHEGAQYWACLKCGSNLGRVEPAAGARQDGAQP
ncbi:hypothetical protein ACIPH4_10925 [Streptomyces tendae]|uniref:hypothetical protein n=1 Tax=Streptomyces tendae TaxID=1932 RepID=UPI0038132655